MTSIHGRKIRLRLARRSRLIVTVRAAAVARDTSLLCAVLEGKVGLQRPSP